MTAYRDFLDRLGRIEARALAVGSNLTELCKLSGISRATPIRWRNEQPKTLKAIESLESALVEVESRQQQQHN